MKRKVLILGGGGFIGSAIARILSKRENYNITIADNFHHNQDDEIFMNFISDNNIKLFKADFTEKSSFDLLEDKYDDFYMLASMIGVNNTLENPHEIIRVNTALIYNSLEWVKNNSIKNLLFTSTSECYAGTVEAFDYQIPTAEEVPLTIQDITHPRFTYAVTKMLGESGFIQYANKLGFECTIVRYHNVYGQRMGFKHVIPHLAQRFLNGENPFKIYGADQTRAFNHIDDAVNGTVLAMEKGGNGEIYHIGTQEEITIKELIQYTGELMGFKGEYIDAPTYPGSVARRCPDISKAKKDLGYEPKVSWKDGLKDTINWYVDYLDKNKDLHESFYDNKKSK